MKIIILSDGSKCLVDDEDFESLSKNKWTMSTGGYAYRKKPKNKYLAMHRQIMNVSKDQTIDHINGNPIDNRKQNLRFCTDVQNGFNTGKRRGKTTSKYKGVSLCSKDKKWKAYININKKCTYIGSYKTEKEAAKAYNYVAEKLYEEYAVLNDLSCNHKTLRSRL